MTSRYLVNPLTTTPLWHVIDASGHPVGKLASKISLLLRGKHKPIFDRSTPLTNGDYVVVLNAHRAEFTGKKWDQKLYRKHSGYPGGLKETKARDMREKNPQYIIKHAVMGMLPRNDTRHAVIERLKVYDGIWNPHAGQITKTPSSSLTLNMGPKVEEELDVDDKTLKEYFAGYVLNVDNNKEEFAIEETKVLSHKEQMKKERRLLRKKRVNELKPLKTVK
eukprot:gene6780-8412_t